MDDATRLTARARELRHKAQVSASNGSTIDSIIFAMGAYALLVEASERIFEPQTADR